MLKKNKTKLKKRYKLIIKQKRAENDVVTIEYSNAKKIKYKYCKRKKWVTAEITGFKSEQEKIEYTDVIAVSKSYVKSNI